MTEIVSIEQARRMDGLRMVSLGGVPSPWTEAARGLFRIKSIEHVLARQGEDEPADAAMQWVGDVGVPAVVYNDEKVRTRWDEILLLAERLAPEVPLLPADAAARAWCLGLAHEICGEMGLGWCQRYYLIDQSFRFGEAAGFPRHVAEYLAPRYGWFEGAAEVGKARVIALLKLFAGQLGKQDYLIDNALTAADVYLATFANLIRPLPPEQLPMTEMVRKAYTCRDSDVMAAFDDRLAAHQERVYQRHLELPVQL